MGVRQHSQQIQSIRESRKKGVERKGNGVLAFLMREKKGEEVKKIFKSRHVPDGRSSLMTSTGMKGRCIIHWANTVVRPKGRTTKRIGKKNGYITLDGWGKNGGLFRRWVR